MSRRFRLFISSTFEDFKDERNALHRDVFPQLQELCEERGARFQAIDLRWGVSDEAGLDQRTMPLCLREIERCQKVDRPNFLILLGNRYGWRPLPATIPAVEFDTVVERVPDGRSKELLEEWYVLDENADPAEYYLKPRDPDGEYGTSSDPKLKEKRKTAWNGVAAEMRAALIAAIEDFDLSRKEGTRQITDSEARHKYVASATHQEIEKGAFRVPDSLDHVFAYLRDIPDLPETDPAAARYRDVVKDASGEIVGVDEDAAKELSALKRLLTDYVPGTTSIPWEDGTPDLRINDFTAAVLEHLSEAIEQRLGLDEDTDSVDLEVDAHAGFAEIVARHFTGRATALEKIADYVADDDARPLIVHGVSGSGKSSLMARAALDTGDGGLVAVRFIGATAASSTGRGLIGDLCRQIGKHYGDDSPVPDDAQELAEMFPQRLGLATGDQPLTIFIDAVDQLTPGDPARRLSWLPASLPDHVRLVVSTLPGETMDAAVARDPALLEIEPMEATVGEELLTTWLDDAGRTLQPHQRRLVLESFEEAGGLPLYLKLAFEEARMWRSGDDDVSLADDIPGLIRQNLFTRLADPVNHGDLIVARALGYLAAARYGLAEDEIVQALSQDQEVFDSIADRPYHEIPETGDEGRQIPIVVWARLYADLEPYLAERSADGASTLDFYHRQFREAAEEAFLSGSDGAARHSLLADLFRAKADPPTGDEPWSGDDIRGLAELPFHLVEAERLDDVYEVLTDFRFMERKVAEVGIVEQSDGSKLYTGVSRLRDDFDHALAAMPGEDDEGERRRIILTAVDLGDGLQIRCPHCNTSYPFDQEWRGQDIPCPGPDCRGPLRINPFIVGEDAIEKWASV